MTSMPSPSHNANNSSNGHHSQNCIVLLLDSDDDDDDDDDSDENKEKEEAIKKTNQIEPQQATATIASSSSSSSSSSSRETAAVESLMTIMQLSDRVYAETVLKRFDYHVERAISHVLWQQQQQPSTTMTTTTKRSLLFSGASSTTKNNHHAKEKTRVAAASKRAREEDAKNHPSQTMPSDMVLLSINNDNNNNIHATRSLYCQAWHDAYRQTPTDGVYQDPDFGPQTSSIDGRMRNVMEEKEQEDDGNNKKTNSKKATSIVQYTYCACGVVAQPKVVQSEGPNYGRFYLVCGRLNSRKRARVVVPSSPTNNVTTTTTTTTTTNHTTTNVNQNNNNNNNNHTTTATNTATTTITIHNPYAKKTIQPPQPPAAPPQPSSSSSSSPSRPPLQRTHCDFFQWDAHGSQGAAIIHQQQDAYTAAAVLGRFRQVTWQHFGIQSSHVLFANNNNNNKSKSSSIQQGSLGNCWFLSALVVVAEQDYLIQQLLPHEQLNDKGVYQVNLCLNGKWTPVLVDSYLPVVPARKPDDQTNKQKTASPSPSRKKKKKKQAVFSSSSSSSSPLLLQQTLTGSVASTVFRPAFCAMPDKQLWPALIEKAYAKAHGSYANLSGGFIAEGLTDLTGAPTETILLDGGALIHYEVLWTRMLSFAQAGFLMGVATARGGDGLVGGHAYSILDVIEIQDSVVGEQAKMTDFLARKKSAVAEDGDDDDDDVIIVNNPSGNQRKQTIRLVRIRNPWGKREWKGEWSADSERWTKALRNRLGKTTYTKGDGTFFMAFHDMIQRFHHMDVAKTRKGWVFTSVDGQFRPANDPIKSSQTAYRLVVKERTWTFISVVQPKKRANTTSTYYYCDVSAIIMKRKLDDVEWVGEAVILAGIKRSISLELFLDPTQYEYVCVPFSCVGATAHTFSFRLTAYSAGPVELLPIVVNSYAKSALPVLHKELLSRGHNLLYPVAPNGLLGCIHGEGCLYFVAMNGATNSYLSIKLSVDVKDGILVVFGNANETHDIAPRSQKVLAILSGNGKLSTASEITFRYLSSVQAAGSLPRTVNSFKFGSDIPLTMSGDLLVSSVDAGRVENKGQDTVDTYLWIPQLGATKVTQY